MVAPVISDVIVHSHGVLCDGSPVEKYILRSSLLEVTVSTYGARIVDIKARGFDAKWTSVVLGFASLSDYVSDQSYMGAVIGRYANRISHGRFSIGGNNYEVTQNEGVNSLHGGGRGFDKRVWAARADGQSVAMHYTSACGEEGYPGSLAVIVKYELIGDELHLRYRAQSTADSPVNLTNHVYFNLNGNPRSDVMNHIVTLQADSFTPVDCLLIPTGELRPVRGTPFDFTQARPIGEFIDAPELQLEIAGGYDHNWVLSKPLNAFGHAASVYDPHSRIQLDVLTSEPGLQFYTGNQLTNGNGAAAATHGHRSGFCMETQHFPDSPNQPGFPSTILAAGKIYQSHTAYRFTSQ